MRFFGKIGFIYQHEKLPGIWVTTSEEHDAYGDVLSDVRRWESGSEVNSSLTTSNRISIVADRFLCEHMGAMRYVKWNGTTWEIRSVELVIHRAILTLGGVYKGESVQKKETPTNDQNGR